MSEHSLPAAQKTVLALWSSFADHIGTHRTMLSALETVYKSKGYSFLKLDVEAPQDRQHIVRLIQSPNIFGVHIEQGWGLDLATKDGPLFAHHRVPAVAYGRDGPHAEWLQPIRQPGPPDWRVICHVDRAARPVMQRMGWAGDHSQYMPHFWVPRLQQEPQMTWQDRPIPTLYVGSYRAPSDIREKLTTLLEDVGRLDVLPVFDAAMEENDAAALRPVVEVVTEVSRLQGLEIDPAGEAFAALVHGCGKAMEMKRRYHLIQGLSHVPSVIVWNGDWPSDVALHPKTTVLPKQPFLNTLVLMAQSQIMVMGLPPFTHGYSERLLSALHRGVLPLTTVNHAVQDVFSEGQHVMITRTTEDIAPQIEKALADQGYMGQVLAQQGRYHMMTCPEFSPITFVEREIALFHDIRAREGHLSS